MGKQSILDNSKTQKEFGEILNMLYYIDVVLSDTGKIAEYVLSNVTPEYVKDFVYKRFDESGGTNVEQAIVQYGNKYNERQTYVRDASGDIVLL